MFTIGIYPRKSVYRDNSDSVVVQVKLCKDYAKIVFNEKGQLIFKIYDQDEGFSGKNTNRPGFQALMEDVKNNRLNAVIVYKLDRISRNVQEFSAMYHILQDHKVEFVSVKESFDTSTPMGRTVMYILAAFAQLERENTSERVSDNMLALGAAGKWTGGKLPAGMTSMRKKVNGKEHSYLLVDKDNIGKVKILYDLMLNGYSITGIERYCRDSLITSQAGKYLNTSQIFFILSNPVYCQNDIAAYYYFKDKGCGLPEKKLFDGTKGLMAYGRTTTTGTKRTQNLNGCSISIGLHDWVIQADQWIAVQKRFGENKQCRMQKHEVGILKGVLRCKCGQSMQNRVYLKKGKMFAYYFCPDRDRKGVLYCDADFVKIETIDQLFIDKLARIKLAPDSIRPRDSFPVSDIRVIKKEIQSTKSAIENLTIQLQENAASSAAKYIIEKIESLDHKLAGLNGKLRYEEIQEGKKRSETEERDDIYDQIVYLVDNIDNLSYKEKNEIVKKIVKNCTLDESTLTISF